jgi:hypothetical protein
MRSKFIFRTLFTYIIAGILMTACSEEAMNTINQEESYADRNSVFAQQTFDQEQFIVDKAIISYSNSGKSVFTDSISCLVTTFDILSSPMKATLDFGTSNCLCADNKLRRGKIIVTFNGPLMDSATYVSSTFEDYFVNDNQIIGTRIVTNKGHNANGHLNFQVVTDGSIVLANNGGTIKYKTNHNREWTAGENTPLEVNDDVYSFSGSSSGTTTSNQDFTIIIASPLIWTVSCNRMVGGIFELTPEGEVTRVVNFGNGECDKYATVTVLGVTFQITLP